MNPAWRGIRRYLKDVVACRLCRNVALLVLFSILIIEGAILVPSYRNYERDLLKRLDHVGGAIVAAGLRGQGHADGRRLLLAGRLVLNAEEIQGGAIYDAGGALLGSFGRPPRLTPVDGPRNRRDADGDSYEVVYSADRLGVPLTVVANLRAGWIGDELDAFLLRIVGLVMLITAFVTAATMAVIGHFVLSPLLNLRDHLKAAAADPENPHRFVVASERRDELGEVIGQFNGLLHHVSAAHRSTRERLAAMVDNSINAVFAAEAEDGLVYANRAALSLAKVASLEEMQRTGFPRVTGNGGEDRSLADYLCNAPDPGEIELLDTEGKRTICLASVNRLPSRGGRPALYYASVIDITHRRESEQALHMAMRQSDIANRAKTEFLANMSHELRTPLNAVIGFAEILHDEMLGPMGTEAYVEYARDIRHSAENLLAILNDILDLSRIDADITALSEAPADIDQLVRDCVVIAQGRVDSGSAAISVEIASDLPPLICDQRLLKQVFLNLLGNALKFTPDDGAVEITAGEAAAGRLWVAIRDTGAGIPAERMEEILEPFGQLAASYTRVHDGPGLGLPLARKICELHGAEFAIDSTPGTGTTVTVTFPADRLLTAIADKALERGVAE
ncbi:MAG: ATP-binding protein [Alphaproteobacteria bacterium]|jgi:signal transduction histidine kinase|nr:ATP-binding protein [Alphaproteobacteria bacterium]MDP6566118.1 ATP-binding protein [Alphaproteobacteria bacterium]MDP6813776.1 ATP-binding protein [Alphaproteobacteria bacterium]